MVAAASPLAVVIAGFIVRRISLLDFGSTMLMRFCARMGHRRLRQMQPGQYDRAGNQEMEQFTLHAALPIRPAVPAQTLHANRNQ